MSEEHREEHREEDRGETEHERCSREARRRELEDVTEFERAVLWLMRQFRLLLRSNVFWLWFTISVATLLIYIPPDFVSKHPWLMTAIPVTLAQLHLMYKIIRNIQKPDSETYDFPVKPLVAPDVKPSTTEPGK